MNQKQKIVILCGILALLVMSLFPPWTAVRHPVRAPLSPRTELPKMYRFWGYHGIFKPPKVSNELRNLIKLFDLPIEKYRKSINQTKRLLWSLSFQIDYTRLKFQWLLVILVTIGLVIVLGDKKIVQKTKATEIQGPQV